MKKMILRDLIDQLRQIVRENGRDDFAVNVIFDGKIDETPTLNVDGDTVYIEGMPPEKK